MSLTESHRLETTPFQQDVHFPPFSLKSRATRPPEKIFPTFQGRRIRSGG